MRPILPAILLLAVACSAPRPSSMTSASAAAPEETSDAAKGPGTVMVHDESVELADKPVTVTLPIASHRARLLEIARDPKRTLVLRVEGIGVTAPPSVNYEVYVGNATTPSGMLALYGADESNGTHVASVTIDEAALGQLDGDTLAITFRPRGNTDANGREIIELQGRTRFTRLRLVEE